MSYIFGKLWHLAIIWAIRKEFQCILQGVRFLLANHTRLSPTSDNDSYVSFIWFWFIADQSDIPHQKGIPNAIIKILEIFCFCWCWCTWLLNKTIIIIQRREKYSKAMCWCTPKYFDVLRKRASLFAASACQQDANWRHCRCFWIIFAESARFIAKFLQVGRC